MLYIFTDILIVYIVHPQHEANKGLVTFKNPFDPDRKGCAKPYDLATHGLNSGTGTLQINGGFQENQFWGIRIFRPSFCMSKVPAGVR